MNSGYLTRQAITSEIKTVVAKKHNLRKSDIIVCWLSKWKIITFPTGLKQKAGKIVLKAVGYKDTVYFVYQSKYDKWYMR